MRQRGEREREREGEGEGGRGDRPNTEAETAKEATTVARREKREKRRHQTSNHEEEGKLRVRQGWINGMGWGNKLIISRSFEIRTDTPDSGEEGHSAQSEPI